MHLASNTLIQRQAPVDQPSTTLVPRPLRHVTSPTFPPTFKLLCHGKQIPSSSHTFSLLLLSQSHFTMDASATASPSKRRALAPLDANAVSSPKPATAFGLAKQQQQQQQQQPKIYMDASPLRKRAVEASAVAASPRPQKKIRVEEACCILVQFLSALLANTGTDTGPIHTLAEPHPRSDSGGGGG